MAKKVHIERACVTSRGGGIVNTHAMVQPATCKGLVGRRSLDVSSFEDSALGKETREWRERVASCRCGRCVCGKARKGGRGREYWLAKESGPDCVELSWLGFSSGIRAPAKGFREIG